jgi:MFS family permease
MLGRMAVPHVPRDRPALVVAALGTAQTLAWASSYYLPAILAPAIAADLRVGVPLVFAAFSCALIVSAFTGPLAGRLIDRHGGRPVLAGTSLVFAAGLAALASAQHTWSLFAAWALLGIGMGAGLYEAAFSALVRLYGADSRRVITGITLLAGFASTVGWPLSAWMESMVGWRGACLAWAGLHLAVGLPLNLLLPRALPATARTRHGGVANTAQAASDAPRAQRFAPALVALVFAMVWFVSTAMGAHFPRVLEAGGASLAAAVAMGALIGPAQVGGRLLEFGLLRRMHPLLAARLAALAHPLGVAALLLFGTSAGAFFAIAHGAGNGILTIAMGTLPLVLFGARGYGARQGWLMFPARMVQALAPFAFGVALERAGLGALYVSAAMGIVAFIALMALRPAR